MKKIILIILSLILASFFVNALEITVNSPIEGETYIAPFGSSNYQLGIDITTDIPTICYRGGATIYDCNIVNGVELCAIFYDFSSWHSITTELTKEHTQTISVELKNQTINFSCVDAENNTEYTSVNFKAIEGEEPEINPLEELIGRIEYLEEWKNTIPNIIQDILDRLEALEEPSMVLQPTFYDINGCIMVIPSGNYYIDEINQLKRNDCYTNLAINNLEDDLEEKCSECPQGEPLYLNYLSESDKKRMLCGYMLDNMLTEYEDLGLNCTATYKTYNNGKVKQIKCKCN